MMNALVIDLDGTLLHSEEEAYKVPGHSGYCYFSNQAAELLAQISQRLPLIIATARNNHSVYGFVRQLPEVKFAGFVMENGMVSRTTLEANPRCDLVWNQVAAVLPDWERLSHYEKCFGAIIPHLDQAAAHHKLDQTLRLLGINGHIYTERHKIFACKEAPSKFVGLQRLAAKPYIVLGNDWNDLDLMRFGAHNATLADAAPEVKHLVHKKHGYQSSWVSHRGTIDALLWVHKIVFANNNKPSKMHP